MKTKWQSFNLTQDERIKLSAFIAKHTNCPDMWIKFSGSSGIGVNCNLKCSCGKEEDITDYSAAGRVSGALP